MEIKRKDTSSHSKITKKKRIRKVLGNHFTHFENILSHLNTAILVLNNENEVVFANKSFCTLYDLTCPAAHLRGLSAKKILNKIGHSRIDAPKTDTRIQDILTAGKPVADEEAVLKNGRTYIRNFIPLVIDGQPSGRIWHNCDVTKLKQTEEALRESEERFRKLFENHAAVMLVIDPDTGKIIDANKEAAKFYGWPVKVLRQMQIGQINPLPPEALEREMRKARVAQSVKYEFQHRLADGSVREVEVFSTRQRTSGKDLLYSIIHDITDRKQAEAEKERLEAQNRLLRKSESLSRMAGAIAHHFNNQLQVITMNMELAKSCLPRGTGSTEFLTDVLKSANKVAEVSNMMLTYLGETVAKREPLNLSDICQQHLSTLMRVLKKEMKLKTDIIRPGLVIKGNASQIEQILTNLVTNAVEAADDQPDVIQLSIGKVPAADIPVKNRFPINFQPHGHEFACLKVADTGVGIPNQDIENLFDPFFSSKFTGRGMGLAVVLGILRAHSGCITVESKPGKGSVFQVFLPVLTGAAAAKPVQPGPAPKGSLILVVEDEPSVSHAFEVVLKLFGHSVLTAKDGIEAVEIFKQHQGTIDCVLCDICMPRMNGWDTLSALRKLSPKIPVIITSGYNETLAMAGNNNSEQPQAFLSKPFDLQRLAETLKQVLEKPKAG